MTLLAWLTHLKSGSILIRSTFLWRARCWESKMPHSRSTQSKRVLRIHWREIQVKQQGPPVCWLPADSTAQLEHRPSERSCNAQEMPHLDIFPVLGWNFPTDPQISITCLTPHLQLAETAAAICRIHIPPCHSFFLALGMGSTNRLFSFLTQRKTYKERTRQLLSSAGELPIVTLLHFKLDTWNHRVYLPVLAFLLNSWQLLSGTLDFTHSGKECLPNTKI